MPAVPCESWGRLQVECWFTIAEFYHWGLYVYLNFVSSGVEGIFGKLGHSCQPPSTCAPSEPLKASESLHSLLFLVLRHGGGRPCVRPICIRVRDSSNLHLG